MTIASDNCDGATSSRPHFWLIDDGGFRFCATCLTDWPCDDA